MILLSKLIELFSDELHQQYGNLLLPGHKKALQAMRTCRTEESPVFLARCSGCGTHATFPHSPSARED